jgi:hypothetical protein
VAFAAVPLQRSWGRFAIWAYVAAAPVALLLARTSPRHNLRLVLAVAVMVGATVAPLLVSASQRGDGDPGANAQSEVLIVEEGATALLAGRNPYTEEYLTGPLASRPLPTKTHLPYPPAMLTFGLPKAIVGAGPGTDARIWFLVVSLAVAIPAIRAMRTDREGRLRSFQVLFALPTGAMLLATGGHDVPVLAVLLAAFVLADRERAGAAGLASGAALAMRQTSVLAIPFVLSILPRRQRARSLAWAIVPVLVVVAPFLLWSPAAFVEDVVLFPLGLGGGRSSARTPTLGSLLIDLAPRARTPITIALVVAILASALFLLRMRPATTAAGASARAAVAFAVAIALAPAARFGYLVYPIELSVWALAFARAGTEDPEAHAAPEADPSIAARNP